MSANSVCLCQYRPGLHARIERTLARKLDAVQRMTVKKSRTSPTVLLMRSLICVFDRTGSSGAVSKSDILLSSWLLSGASSAAVIEEGISLVMAFYRGGKCVIIGGFGSARGCCIDRRHG